MSGIAGYYGLSANEALVPDGEGAVVDGPVGLAKPQLSSADGRWTIAFDGAIHNHAALRTELVGLGRTFVTDGDAEVVLHAFAQWGGAGFDRLGGQFGLAIWDRDEQRLTLARDHFGIKPIHVCRVPADVSGSTFEALLFSSEIRPILTSGVYEKTPNERSIYRYLAFGAQDDGTETFFDGIERLQAGEMLEVDADGIRRSMFTRLREELTELAEKQSPYDDAAATAYKERLDEAVRLRLPAQGSVGVSVSENPADSDLASSAVAVVVGQVGAKPTPISVRPTADEFKADLRNFIRSQEEPLATSDGYVQFQVMREAGEHVSVVFDAVGAPTAAAEFSAPSGSLLRRGQSLVTARLRGRKDVPVASLLNAKFVGRFTDETFSLEQDNVKKRLLEDLFRNSLPGVLRRQDRNARHFAVQTRQPFLDKDLVGFVLGLSDDAITKGGWNSCILRDAMRGALPESVSRRRSDIDPAAAQSEWFMRLKNHFYSIFLSEPFANRPYFKQTDVLHAFEGWIKGSNSVDTMTFWRILNLELWLQEYFDEAPQVDKAKVQAAPKDDVQPNAGKNLDITTERGETVRRYPLRTELFDKGDDLDAKVLPRIDEFFSTLPAAGPEHDAATRGQWYLFISEKIIAITQGRSYFIWDIKVGKPARILSKYVTRTPAGIGLGSPFTMQLAIEEAGLPRVLYAAAGGAVGKAIGRKGLFYELVGNQIAAIDGPTEYSAYPSNVSAKLAPKDPDQVAARLSAGIRSRVPAAYKDSFAGTIVMDANDIGRNVLGSDVADDKSRFEEMFADNPLGQGSEQTPMALVFVQD
ncbi:MAG: asparagine synthase-related protein [Knoellia sp.]